MADKPTVLTAQGKLERTPNSLAVLNRVSSNVTLRCDDSGHISGESTFLFQGPSAIAPRDYFVGYWERDKAELVPNRLAGFGPVGQGEYHIAPMRNLDNPVAVNATFELEPVSNFPGPGAMPIPIGLAPGRIAAFRTQAPRATMTLLYVCHSYSIIEIHTLVYPDNVKITGLPPDQWFDESGHVYRARYRQDGHHLTVERELVVQVSFFLDPKYWLKLTSAPMKLPS